MIFNVETLRSVWAVLVVLTLLPSAASLVLHLATWRGARGQFWWFIALDLAGFVLVLGTVMASLWWRPHPIWFDWARVGVFLAVFAAVYWRLVLQARSLLRARKNAQHPHRGDPR